MTFSQRMGLSPVRKALQVDSMDEELSNSLWNVLQISIWDRFLKLDGYANAPEGKVFIRLWADFLKKPLDTLTKVPQKDLKVVRDYFFNCNWYDVYDFLEFIAKEQGPRDITDHCNLIFARECAGYRFINKSVGPITSEEEILAVEAATAYVDAYEPASEHLKTSLQLLSDRTSPDHRNSIKESISAVEAACRIVTADPNATLGPPVNKLEDRG